jgi:hypothetical protein
VLVRGNSMWSFMTFRMDRSYYFDRMETLDTEEYLQNLMSLFYFKMNFIDVMVLSGTCLGRVLFYHGFSVL